jgi:hypothetical protein
MCRAVAITKCVHQTDSGVFSCEREHTHESRQSKSAVCRRCLCFRQINHQSPGGKGAITRVTKGVGVGVGEGCWPRGRDQRAVEGFRLTSSAALAPIPKRKSCRASSTRFRRPKPCSLGWWERGVLSSRVSIFIICGGRRIGRQAGGQWLGRRYELASAGSNKRGRVGRVRFRCALLAPLD